MKAGYQSIRESGCRISETQDIRKNEDEGILKPDTLIARYPLPDSLIFW